MKKSQILAALALAFALGVSVVAPVADTHAKYGGSSAEAAASKKSVDAAIKAAYSVKNFSEYAALIPEIAKAETAVKAMLDGRFTNLQTELNKVVSTGNGLNFNPANYTDYNALLSAANARIANQTADINAQDAILANTNSTDDEKTAATNAKAGAQLTINAIEGALNAAATADDAANIYDAQAQALMTAMRNSKMFDLSNIMPSDNGKYTEADYTNIYNLATSGKYDQYKALVAATGKAETLENAADVYGPQAVANAVANVEAAINAINNNTVTPNPEPVDPDKPGTDTPTTPDDGKGEDNTDKVGTPNDGALAKAEGSTSASASIMAAIATALTAAGAAFIAIRRKIAAKKEA